MYDLHTFPYSKVFHGFLYQISAGRKRSPIFYNNSSLYLSFITQFKLHNYLWKLCDYLFNTRLSCWIVYIKNQKFCPFFYHYVSSIEQDA